MIFEYLISLPKIMSANIGIRALKMSAIQTTLWIMQPRQHNSEPRIEIKMITGLKSISLKSHHDRSKWVQTLLDNSLDNDNSNLSDMHLSSHATGLLLEALNAFCSGNWVATIILAQAVFDVDIAKNKRLNGLHLNILRTGKSSVWLRNRRNRLIHADNGAQSITEAELGSNDSQLESEAKRALKIVIQGLTKLSF